MLNSAHDSSCACSADEVVDAVTVRYEEARQIGDGLTADAVRSLAAQVDAPTGSTIVVNPSPADRGGIVRFALPGEGPLYLEALDDGSRHPAQVSTTERGTGFATTVTPDQISWLTDMMRGPELAGSKIANYTLDRRQGDAVLTATAAGTNDTPIDLGDLRDEVGALAAAGLPIAVRVMRAPRREIIASLDTVPGFGWRTFRAVDGEGPSTDLRAGEHWLENEYLRVDVDPHTGTYEITTSDGVVASGLGRLVEGGDGGDTYNYSPPTKDLVIDVPEAVTVTCHEAGPVVAELRILTWYRWPQHAVGDERRCTRRSDEQILTEVTTTLELRAGEPMVRVHTELDHRCRDHRLRVHFPLPRTVTSSHAECAFAVVERGLTAEGGPHETPLPTFVSRRFVDASDGSEGVAILHDGLLEYELVGEGSELALTLLRATGYLSRSEMALRPNPAGPLDPLRGPQLQGPVAMRYAVAVHRGTWDDADLYALADDFLVPLERVRATGGGSRAPLGRPLQVVGAMTSSVTRDPGGVVVRVFNPTGETATVAIQQDDAPSRGWRIDLRGRPLERVEGEFPLHAHGIATIRLDP